MESFVTHTGEIVTGERLTKALNAVADFWAQNAMAVYKENAYASHVSEKTKINNRERQLEQAERIRSGNEKCGFWLWQRINTELTGECVAFLPK